MTILEKKYSQLKTALITLEKANEDFEKVIKGDFKDKDKFAEAEKTISMALSRNDTSHMYREEVADYIASQIKHHAKLMNTLAQRLSP